VIDGPVAPAQPDLSDRTAIVTGASSGLGNRFARVLHGAGATVITLAHLAGPLEALAVELGERIVPVRYDVTVAADGDRAVEAAGSHVDILVSNAGVGDVVPAEEESDDQFRAAMGVNLIAVFMMSRREPCTKKDGAKVFHRIEELKAADGNRRMKAVSPAESGFLAAR
jgi:NAD(P)-dependent dehydrogenase (short-subunit alcohol dehydrogenase family)